MTREEAIIELKKKIICTIGGLSKEEYNATVMAISALSAETPTTEVDTPTNTPTTEEETIKWLESLKAEIGKSEHRTLWHYAEAIDMAIEALQTNAEIETCATCKYYETNHKEYPCSDCTFENSYYTLGETIQGEWLEIPNSDFWECSVCGKPNYPTDYCPDCGARMKGDI